VSHELSRCRLQIGGVPVGADHPTFVIAEMSGNHGGSLARALSIVDAASSSGATAIKLQTYTADSMTLDTDAPGFVIEDPASLWFGRRLFDLYQEAATPYEWVPAIMERAADQGILCFSSPFDVNAVEFLDGLGVPCFKIASLENNDHALISAAASTGKPLIISTGASTLEEIDEAVDVARSAGCTELVLLKCTSSYPAEPDDIDLRAIPMLRERYGCEVGFSDHTRGIGVAVAAVAVGATVIEKHLTDDRAAGGVDAAFSMEPEEMRSLITECERARRALGLPQVRVSPSEASTRTRRRSLFVVRDLSAGAVLTDREVRSLRPNLGLPPSALRSVLGRSVAYDTEAGTPIAWSLLTESDSGGPE
jgi:pseudaminic acid synthase